MNFFSLPKTEEAAIIFLQSKNILPTNNICENGHEMKLSIDTQISWRCSKSMCRSEVNIRVGNWLEGSHIPIVTIVRFIYAWAIGMTAVNNKFCERELEMDSKTRTDWNNNLSSICVEHVVNKQKNLGRENVNVEIHRNRAEFMCRQEVKKEDFFEWILKKIAEIRPPK